MRNYARFVAALAVMACSASANAAPNRKVRSAAAAPARTPAASRSTATRASRARTLKVGNSSLARANSNASGTSGAGNFSAADTLMIAAAEAEAMYAAELASLNDDIVAKNKEIERYKGKLDLKKSEYIDWFKDDCESNNGYTTGAGLTQKCKLCTADKEPDPSKSSCIESTASKEEKMAKDQGNCEKKNAFWLITDETNFRGRCVICSGAYEPGYPMNEETGAMGDVMSCQKTAATLAQEKKESDEAAAAITAAAAAANAAANANNENMYNIAKTYLDERKGKKNSGSIRLGPGTYGYELSGAGGGGGGGGSSKSGCTSKADGGDGGNGELKTGTFTISEITNIEFSVGGNISGAGDCGYGGSDNGAKGEDSYIKYGTVDTETITAVGGGGGTWTNSRRKSSPSGNGAAGGEGGGKGRPDPKNGASGWFILTSYTP